MKILSTLILTLVLLTSTASFAENTRAKGKLKNVSSTERQAVRFQKKLARLFATLTPEQKAKILASRSASLVDSDNDGLPDVYESDTALCDDDSDDDGVNDREEYEDGSDPNDSDSDDDGVEDGSEIEIHAAIAAISETEITVNETTLGLTPSTEYLDDDNNPISRSELEVGDCVEVEGHLVESTYTAEKVKRDDDC